VRTFLERVLRLTTALHPYVSYVNLSDLREMKMNWKIEGDIIIACNCDYGCPCNFNGLPTRGKCEGNWNWRITDGHYGDVKLDGLTVSIAVNWPAAIHEGNGEGIVIIDEAANDKQREALVELTSGRVGGPWQIIMTTITKLHGPEFAKFEFSADSYNSRIRAGDFVVVEMEPVRNKVTKAETHPRAILPEGFIVKEAELGASRTFRISGPVSFDHSGHYAAFGRFSYQSA
jgi:hypothetical protein